MTCLGKRSAFSNRSFQIVAMATFSALDGYLEKKSTSQVLNVSSLIEIATDRGIFTLDNLKERLYATQ